MASIWLESVSRNLQGALDLMAAAVRDCPDDLWETPMWPVSASDLDFELLAPDGSQVTEPADRQNLVQRHSTPWAVSWHALEVLDYDLTGEFGPWAPPPPFAGHPHWQLTRMPSAWSPFDILSYIDYCRDRVRETMAGMTEAKASAPLPPAHRYRGQPHAWIISGTVGHTIEHAAQIRQFITDAAD